MCGASGAQSNIQQGQTGFFNQLTSQAGQVFGNASSVFNQLMRTFSPTVAAGPSQYGFSNQEDSNLRSGAITATGQAYKNEKQALGDAQATQNSVAPGGANIGQQASLAENSGNQTANELNQITQAGYQQGNANYKFAAEGLTGAPSVFGAATNAAGAATSAGSAASTTANEIAQQNNSWVQGLTGALGGVAGAAAGNPAAFTSIFGTGSPGANPGANAGEGGNYGSNS